ncbi:MAG TPA: glycosyltransferase family 1 protein, partial [Polyangiaceae bacterium]|nr:glycosyltransferase family 1 protein [Polyangiaceae bacterium]
MSLDYDLICLSHLRWDFVYQRPNHLLSRCARERRVFFVEEPVHGEGPPRLEVTEKANGVRVCTPTMPPDTSDADAERLQSAMLRELVRGANLRDYVAWYYTPMALAFTGALRPLATVYDCMDELAAFRGAPPALETRERELLRRADVVFTGGRSLYEAKRPVHPRVHAFPSAVEVEHFAKARARQADPDDQAPFPHPRLGFFGVLDERMDLALLEGVAEARPGWQIMVVGPVVKIDPADLPRRPNLRYLGPKGYHELPRYLAGWDVALMPFAQNESTRLISPTKTPEYLAAGRPVVSTPIRDVVRPYGAEGLVRIADGVGAFVAA